MMKVYEQILMSFFSLLCLCVCEDGYPKLLLGADSHAYVNSSKAITALEEQKDSMATEPEGTPMYSGFPCAKAKEKYQIIKRFDLETFWKNQVGETYEFVNSDGMIVEQRHGTTEAHGEMYIDERRYPNSPYKYSCAYYPDGMIKVSLTQFHSVYIGKDYYYDTTGKLVKEVDNDAPYKFSIDDLILKMKQEYNIDMVHADVKRVWNLNRYAVDNSVFYEVYVRPGNPNSVLVNAYLINGTNGKTLYITESETEWEPGMSEETVYEEYKRVKMGKEKSN